MNYFPKLDMHPLAAFDSERCHRRGCADPDHIALRLVLGRWFAGADARPSASELYAWFSARERSEQELAWCVNVLVSASADPWFGLRSLIREEALSIYDLAKVCMEAGCRHKPFVEWLNQFADAALCDMDKQCEPPAWAIEGMALTEDGYYAPTP